MDLTQRKLEGIIRLACDITGRNPEPLLSALGITPYLYRVQTPNPHFTGELYGVWFDNGKAEVTSENARRFFEKGYRVTEVPLR